MADASDGWIDTPREEWLSCPVVDLLPEDRQRFWQQRRADGDVRLMITSFKIIEAEVFVFTMDRVSRALDKLERKL